MKTKLFPGALAGLSLLAMASCGRADDNDAEAAGATQPAAAVAPATTTAPPMTTAPTAATAAEAAELAAKVGESDLGEVMTSADGLTLYGFVNDVNAISTCYSTCADAWPPVIVDADWAVGPGLDTGVFSTTERADGSLQLVAGKFPLYSYGGDAVPGDTTGQGSGDVWFAIALDGTLIAADVTPASSEAAATTATESTDPYGADPAPADDAADLVAAAPPAAIASTDLGDVLVDRDGLTLYGFTKDADGIPTCEGGCAEAWPPVIVDTDELPASLDPEVFSVVERPDGQLQLKAGTWPLYRFAGDEAPGDVNGQGSGDVWFAVAPDASLVK